MEPLVRGVTSAFGEIIETGQRTQGDVLSHIKRSQNRQDSRLWESLKDILNEIVYLHCTFSDIANEYRNIERSLRAVALDNSESI